MRSVLVRVLLAPVKLAAAILFVLGLAMVAVGIPEAVSLLIYGEGRTGELRDVLLGIPAGMVLMAPGVWLLGRD